MSISKIIPVIKSLPLPPLRYPPELAGKSYPEGISIYPEDELAGLIQKHKVDLVAFSYSDVPHVEVMHKASLAMAKGADFILIGAPYTMLRSKKTIVAVCAVRTGCGKSQTTRKVCEIIKGMGKKVVVIRHPMPYGDLRKQIVQRFSAYEDFEKHQCTIEEREEYEPLVEQGIVVYAGIDYGKILEMSSSGTVATTTRPFTSLICILCCSIPIEPVMSCCISRGKPT
jgi:predicted GTPase